MSGSEEGGQKRVTEILPGDSGEFLASQRVIAPRWPPILHAQGNREFDYSRYTHQQTKQDRQQAPPNTPPPYQRKRTPYEILGISYYATREQIVKAYHNLVKKYPPDINKHADHRTIAEINVAYQTLIKR